jgi:SAM-dependent methyltransferase
MTMLDLEFYDGHDNYSDGDIEEEILRIARYGENVLDVLRKDNRWPLLYHLSPQRRNLLEWYPFAPEASLLEIGAGCGALTGLFCEKVRRVVAVEMSKRRAEIIEARHGHHDHLRIMVGNTQRMSFHEPFDYVTLIGVLEYAGRYMQSQDPYGDFLQRVGDLLQPAGTLILAIENQYGLKYWGGARDDHTGQFFEGLEGYPRSGDMMTFSKRALITLLKRAGFQDVSFYYPYPDYKLPSTVYSDGWGPRVGDILERHAPSYGLDRQILFNEKLVLNGLIREGLFDFFANSFLIFCRKGL